MSEDKVKVEIEEPSKGFLNLFAGKRKIYQARVRGKFRTLKWLIMFPLLSLYYLLPWVRWDRGAGAPDQAVLVDTINRKFYFFFIELWPQEVFYFTGLLLLAALSLFFITAIAGRVWCGYLCPQTVWTDLYFIIERRIEGDRNARMKLDKAPWTFSKIRKKITKHILWLIIALCTGGAWVFYFVDAPTLWQDILRGDIPFVAEFWICLLTFSTYLMAGFAREQVCTYMCPYARFQGAMFDADTLVVAYDEKRGEPRGKNNKGDCIDCLRCVSVCPTGIDIRDGQQYQCINCALCIDACNTVMDKIGKKRGLIRYNSLNNAFRTKMGLVELSRKLHIFRPRVIFYGAVITTLGLSMLYGIIFGRSLLDVKVLRERNPLYITLANGDIRNIYTLHVSNKIHQPQKYILAVNNLDGVKVSALKRENISDKEVLIEVKPDKVGNFRVFVDVPKSQIQERSIPFTFTLTSNTMEDSYKTVFMGPEK